MIRWTPTTRVASERPAPRVLVVDDDATFRASLARWVARWGAGVETAYSGPSALAPLAHGGVDLMILDMHMAPMDGGEVLAAMVAQQDRTPVIVVSGLPVDEVLARVAEVARAPVVTVLEKPIWWSELRAALERALPSDGVVCPTPAGAPRS